MSAAYFYSSTAGVMHLTVPVSALDTVLAVDGVAGLPANTPFTLLLEPGTSSEEIVTVTSAASLNLTVIRGEDGSVGASHAAGSQVVHGAVARDLRLSRTHEANSSGVHGTTGAVVGTTDTQTLTNKTIDGGSNNLTNIGKSSLPGTAVYTTDTQTLTNKTLTSPTINTPAITAPVVTGGLGTDTVATSGNASVGGTLAVTGATTLAGATNTGNETINGNETVSGTLGVSGTATVGNLVTGGSVTAAGAVAATGAVSGSTVKTSTMPPVYVFQVAGQDATYANTGQWRTFPTAAVPHLTVTVPPSGRVRITASATPSNTNTATSTCWFSYYITTASVSAPVDGSASSQAVWQDAAGVVYTASGTGRTATGQDWWGVRGVGTGPRASTSTLFAGLTPGDTLTLVAQYNISSGTSSTASTINASLLAEPLI